MHGAWLQRLRRDRLPHYRFAARAADRHFDQQFCSLQRAFCTTTQRATNIPPGADCQEKTVELTMPFDDFSDCADKIKAYRKKYKLTQEELAEILSHFAHGSRKMQNRHITYGGNINIYLIIPLTSLDFRLLRILSTTAIFCFTVKSD